MCLYMWLISDPMTRYDIGQQVGWFRDGNKERQIWVEFSFLSSCFCPLKGDDVAYVFQDKELGRGTYGRVIQAIHRGTGRKFACKVVNITRMEPRQVSKLYSEVSVMRELDHPHIVRMREVFYSKVRRWRP